MLCYHIYQPSVTELDHSEASTRQLAEPFVSRELLSPIGQAHHELDHSQTLVQRSREGADFEEPISSISPAPHGLDQSHSERYEISVSVRPLCRIRPAVVELSQDRSEEYELERIDASPDSLGHRQTRVHELDQVHASTSASRARCESVDEDDQAQDWPLYPSSPTTASGTLYEASIPSLHELPSLDQY